MFCLAQVTAPVDSFTSLGVAGLMGAMWLWERRTSSERERQIDEAHARILGDRLELDALVDLVRENTQTLSRLVTLHEQTMSRLRPTQAAK